MYRGLHNAVSDRDFDLRNRVEPALIRFSYIVRKASGFLSRGATVSTHWVGGGGQTQTYTRAHRSNFSRLSLCLCFKPIPFVWLIYGAARLFHRERSGESIRCRSCEMIRWNLYSRGEYSLLFLSRCFEDRWDRCCIRRWRNCWKKERMISPRDRWIYF